jgi:hypothetical protein
MGQSRRTILATAILILAAMPIARPAAASSFDGQWSVQIASSNSACGNGATVSIGISRGEVASTDAVVSASGRVADAGNINVSLTSGIKHAVGFGHLSGASGSGTWRGPMCSGTWTAQRI